MDKYEYKVRASEIKQLIEQGEYVQAAEIADTIDWRRVKSVMMLCMISDLYKINRRYEDARDMLLLAYERRPGGRTICYSLCELSIKMEEYVQAIEYYKEYVQATSSPKDTGRYILQYKLYEAQDVSLEERIAVLEKLKQCDYIPKWGYELAYLYHRVGLAARCVEECDELIVWFGDGKYVIKAMELKMLHQPLTPEQQEKYDHRFDDLYTAKQETAEEPEQEAAYAENEYAADTYMTDDQQMAAEALAYNDMQSEQDQQGFGDTQIYSGMQGQDNFSEQSEEMDIHVKTMDVGQYNTINLQAELAAGLREVLAEERPGTNVEDPMMHSMVAPVMEADTESLDTPEVDEMGEAGADELTQPIEEMEGSEVFFGETGEISSFQINRGFASEETLPEEIVPEVAEFSQMPQDRISEVAETVQMPQDRIFEMEETSQASQDRVSEVAEFSQMSQDRISEMAETSQVSQDRTPEMAEASQTPQNTVPDITAEIVMEQLRQEITMSAEDAQTEAEMPLNMEDAPLTEEEDTPVLESAQSAASQSTSGMRVVLPQAVEAMHAEPPKALANVLSQESDGQISLVMPERESIEKQITGQISLDDILIEWERMKKENQEKREAEVRQHVLQQTGSMFTEFEAAVRDGLLEQLERGKKIEDTITPADEVEELEEIQEEAITENPAEVETGEEEFAEIGDFEEENFEDPAEVEAIEETIEEPGETEAWTEDAVGEAAEPETWSEELAEEAVDEAAEPETWTEELVEEAVNEAIEPEVPDEEVAEEAVESETGAELTEEPIEESAEAVEETAEELSDSVRKKTPVVEREKAKVRSLTREEKELFAPFIQGRAAREQLVKAIDNISLAAYTGNVIITGDEGMDTLSLAKNMIREVQAADSNFSGKVAKISGHALNKKDVETTIGQLKNGALIIAKASEINKDTANALHKSLQRESLGIVIVLEDTKKAIDKFLTENEQLKGCFTARMDVEALSNDMLVAFGRQYAREREYSIDDLGMLALHTRIEDMQSIDHAVTVLEVKEIVDEAITHANRKTLGHFFDILFAKRYDEEDMIILSEKDFV